MQSLYCLVCLPAFWIPSFQTSLAESVLWVPEQREADGDFQTPLARWVRHEEEEEAEEGKKQVREQKEDTEAQLEEVQAQKTTGEEEGVSGKTEKEDQEGEMVRDGEARAAFSGNVGKMISTSLKLSELPTND